MTWQRFLVKTKQMHHFQLEGATQWVLTLLVRDGLDVRDGEVELGGESEVAGEDEHQLLRVALLQH